MTIFLAICTVCCAASIPTRFTNSTTASRIVVITVPLAVMTLGFAVLAVWTWSRP